MLFVRAGSSVSCTSGEAAFQGVRPLVDVLSWFVLEAVAADEVVVLEPPVDWFAAGVFDVEEEEVGGDRTFLFHYGVLSYVDVVGDGD